MKPSAKMPLAVVLISCGLALTETGCTHRMHPEFPAAEPLGALSDPTWQNQETNAEASNFVVYQHEFDLNSYKLNMAGQDHVKQIAMRVHSGQDFPVIIERSMTAVQEGSEFEYPVHPSPQLDMRRRWIVVRSLLALGIPDAEQRVVVAPALTPGATATEAQAAYRRSFFFGGGFGNRSGQEFGGFGGGFRGGFRGGIF